VGFSTRAIHAGQPPDPATGAVVTPVYLTSTYVQDAPGRHRGYEYSRTGNPTRAALERCLAALEEGRHGFAFASGLAAEHAVLSLLRPGDHVVSARDIYGGTWRLFEKVCRPAGIRVTYADATRPEALARAFTRRTRLLWLETPSNPRLVVTDLAAACGIARRRRAWSVVDNTFASPYLQQPLRLGADVVVHSTTKYLGGHSDLIGGAVVVNDDGLRGKIAFHQNAVGAVPGPMDCYLVLRGIKTLAVRMDRHCANALAVARALERHPKVRRVHYPGLEGHPGHAVAAAQMRAFGAMAAVELKDDSIRAATRVVTATRLFAFAESLGAVESLIGHPATQSHASVAPAVRRRMGIPDGMLRLSIGIEDVEDLIADLDRALAVGG
jgi:cystathionine gamma-lyase